MVRQALFLSFFTSFALPIVFSPIYADPLQSLSHKLKDRLESEKPVTVAVVSFLYPRGRVSTGSSLVAERLTTYLVQDGIPVVERRLIKKILEEKKFRDTGAVDPASLKNMKQLSGVDAIVVGTLADGPNETTEVAARVIKVQTGEVLATGSVIIPRVWKDPPRPPNIGAGWAPVPAGFLHLGQSKPSEDSGRQHSLSDLDPRRKGPRYFPAPVPFFGATSQQRIKGGRL